LHSQEGLSNRMASPPSADSVASAQLVPRDGRSGVALHAAPSLLMAREPGSAIAEAYRNLAASLHFVHPDQPLRTLAVTSVGTRDDAADTVANLAAAMAEGGRRVILVDADLRRPRLHTVFGADNGDGLSSAVLGGGDSLPLSDTEVPGLRLLPSGPPVTSPVEILGSPRLQRLLARLRDEADIVLFDTAPAVVVADVAVLAPHLDGVLLVVAAGRTRRDLAQRAKEQLERVNAHILGVALTGVRPDRGLSDYR